MVKRLETKTMKLTKEQLKKIVKEELAKIMAEEQKQQPKGKK